jgi:anti-sigma factor RsiW
MRCEEARENLAAHLDGEIEGAPRRAVDEHLAACPACAAERRELAAAWRLLDLVDAPPAPAGFAARLRDRAREGGGAPGGRLLRIPLPAAAAAAAVLLVAAGVVLHRGRGDGTVPPADAPPVPVLEELALLESLDLLQAGDAEALDRLDEFPEDDLAVLGG